MISFPSGRVDVSSVRRQSRQRLNSPTPLCLLPTPAKFSARGFSELKLNGNISQLVLLPLLSPSKNGKIWLSRPNHWERRGFYLCHSSEKRGFSSPAAFNISPLTGSSPTLPSPGNTLPGKGWRSCPPASPPMGSFSPCRSAGQRAAMSWSPGSGGFGPPNWRGLRRSPASSSPPTRPSPLF